MLSLECLQVCLHLGFQPVQHSIQYWVLSLCFSPICHVHLGKHPTCGNTYLFFLGHSCLQLLQGHDPPPYEWHLGILHQGQIACPLD